MKGYKYAWKVKLIYAEKSFLNIFMILFIVCKKKKQNHVDRTVFRHQFSSSCKSIAFDDML